MDSSLKTFILQSPYSPVKLPAASYSDLQFRSAGKLLKNRFRVDRRRSFGDRNVTVAVARRCEFSKLNAPLEPNSPAGLVLRSVLMNRREEFSVEVAEQLQKLADDREAAIARMIRSFYSSEYCIHRKIAELKERECQVAVEDIMYMLIVFKLSEIGVPLIPKLSRCIFHGTLDMLSTRDWELESIHSLDTLEMIREFHTTIVTRGLSNDPNNFSATQILPIQLGHIYGSAIVYGYFLKSASLRHHMELSLAHSDGTHLFKIPVLSREGFVKPRSTSVGEAGSSRPGKEPEKLRYYITRFDPETLERCSRLKTKEAANLIGRHILALFGNEKTGSLESDMGVSVSASSLKRIVLEAVAFGSFIWDIEEYVGSVYKLEENTFAGMESS